MSWLKEDAYRNTFLYADEQQTEGGREAEHTVRSQYTAGLRVRASEWIPWSWRHGAAIGGVWWGCAEGCT